MADVTGTFGNEHVELNNAATEATLRLLLQSSLATTKEQKAAIASLAQKAGLDPAAVAAANKELKEAAPQMNALGKTSFVLGAAFAGAEQELKVLGNTLGTLTSGNATVANVMTGFKSLPGPLGAVASGFSLLANFQQKNLEALQGMASSGANFSGSLTDLRIASAKSFLTLGEFGDAVKKNSDIFAAMGGNVQAGVNQFVKIQNTLLAPGSETSNNLATLGYSAKDAADLTASYMRAQGGMNKNNLQDAQKVSASVAEYAQELNSLAAVTGKSRQAIQEKMDKENAEAQWQATLNAMSPEKADKMRQGMNMAMAQGGQGAVDAFKAMALGLPPMTEAGRLYTATQQAGVGALKQYSDRANDASISTKQNAEMNRKTLAKQISDGAGDREKMQKVLQADALAGGKLSQSFSDATQLQNKFMKDGKMMSEQEIAAELDKQDKESKRSDSQAASVEDGNRRLKEFGTVILELISPIIGILTPALKYLGPVFMGLTVVMGLYKASVMASMALEKLKAAREAGGGALGMARSVLGGGGGKSAGGGASGPLDAVGKLGGGIGPALEGLAGGLKAFANPTILLGAGIFAGSVAIIIAGIGAGVAAAMALIGVSLPIFSEGLNKLSKIDAAGLGSVALGVGKLGLGLVAFAPFALFGLPAAFALNMLADGVVKLNSVDPGKLERVAAAMQKVKDAAPSIGESIAAGIGGLVSKVIGPSEAPATESKSAAAGATSNTNNIEAELKRLNTVSEELLKYIKEIADHSKQNVSATKSLNGDLFSF
jgi:hypothetical protein